MKKILLVLILILSVGCQAQIQIQSIDGNTVYHMLENKEQFVLIDAREESEYKEGHIPGSILIPLGNIEKDIKKYVSSTDDMIVVYCRSGRRSRQACQRIMDMGYTQVYDMGGIIDWKYDIEK